MTTEIMIDYDHRTWGEIEHFFSPFLDTIRPLAKSAEVTRTRKGYHVRVVLDADLGPYEVSALQRSLGSDPRRERANRARLRARYPKRGHRWNRLWQAKLRLDGTARSGESPAEGETKSLVGMLWPTP